MIFDRADLDRRTLERAEKEGLERPSNSSMWDPRLFETHAATLSWAERGDDLAEESNYLKVLEHLRDLAGEDADEHIIDASIRDWAVGSLRQLFVQTRDSEGEFTLAFCEVVAIAIALRDEYPIWDEQDYNDREFYRWQSNVLEELRHVAADDELDEKLTEQLIDAAVTVLQEDGDLDYLSVPDRATLTDAYRRATQDARDEYYTALGTAHMTTQIEGQGSLAL
jgi:hypothetical protein